MRPVVRSFSVVAVLLAPALARADVLPDQDHWTPCKGLKIGDVCHVESIGDGTCIETDCQYDMTKRCGYCDTHLGPPSSSGDEPPDDGCGCRSGGAPGAALALLGLALLARRRKMP